MKNTAIVCALAALTACSGNEATTERENAEAAAVAAAQVPTGPYELQPGVYRYTRSDGVTGVITMTADGTFSNAVTGGEVETGSWGQEGELGCLMPGNGAEKRCYRFSHPNVDGDFTGVMPSGLTVEVRKLS